MLLIRGRALAGAFCEDRGFGVQITRKAEMQALRQQGMGPHEGGAWFLGGPIRRGESAQEAVQAAFIETSSYGREPRTESNTEPIRRTGRFEE